MPLLDSSLSKGSWIIKRLRLLLLNELKRLFRPEFLNRVDEIVVFHSLDKRQVGMILDILLGEVAERLKERDIQFEVTPKTKEYLIEKG